MLRIDLGVTLGPGAGEEAGLNLVGGPGDAAVLAAAVLTVGAGRLADINGELAAVARDAVEEGLAGCIMQRGQRVLRKWKVAPCRCHRSSINLNRLPL